MNIIVLTSGGKVIVRPDTTWERNNGDLFLPEFVDKLSFSPVLAVRICKPGRSIGARFASRYYDKVGSGVLIYPDNLMDGSEEGFACASCLDHTSFITMPDGERSLLSEGQIELSVNGKPVFNASGFSTGMIEDAIAKASRFCRFRIGDIMAMELQGRKPLEKDADGAIAVSGSGLSSIMSFKIV